MNERRPVWAWFFFAQLALVILASVLATTGHFPVAWFQRSPFDKVGHLLAYGGLSFFGVAFFRHEVRWRVIGLLLIAATLEELSQRAFPRRTFDLGDLAMNIVGISVLGAAAAATLAARARHARSPFATDGRLLDDASTEIRDSTTVDTVLRRQLLEEDQLRRELARTNRTLTFERAALRPVLPSFGLVECGTGAFIFLLLASLIFRCLNAP
jgi:hypothetical protein